MVMGSVQMSRPWLIVAMLILGGTGLINTTFSQSKPVLAITYDQAQQLFGNHNAKMLIFYNTAAQWNFHPACAIYMIDFSQNPLKLDSVSEDAHAWSGDPFISPDGSRIAYNTTGTIYTRYFEPGGGGKTLIADGWDQRWWIQPSTGDEYIIFASRQWANELDISGKTYLQKIKKGTCLPEGPVLTLSDNYAFNGGRSVDGHYLYGAQPGNTLGYIADANAVDHANVQIVWEGTEKLCNASASQDPDHPTRFIVSNAAHNAIIYDTTAMPITQPSGYNSEFWGEWSTHKDYLTCSPMNEDDWDYPAKHDGFIYQWSTSKWTKVCQYAGPTHLWVSYCTDNTAPTQPPTGLSAFPASDTKISLSWSPAVDPDCKGIERYNIYRKGPSGSFARIAHTVQLAYLDSNVTENTQYSYYVTGVNGGNVESAPSNTALPKTLPDQTGPRIFSAFAVSTTQIMVTFTEPVDQSTATVASNYSIDHSVSVQNAVLTFSDMATLTVSAMNPSTSYTLTISGIKDRAASSNICISGTNKPIVFSLKGSIQEEKWTNNLWMNVTNQIDTFTNPTSIQTLSSFQNPGTGTSYADRVRAYLYPPTTGTYEFFLSVDDEGQFYLSPDNNIANRMLLAAGNFSSGPITQSTCTSGKINLVGGKVYYIEAVHWQGGGGDFFAVGWQGPGIPISVIDGKYLSPYMSRDGGKAPVPTISPSSSNFQVDIDVYITSSDPGLSMYYTLDGSEPTQSSPRYSQPIKITSTTTVKARGFKTGLPSSDIVSETFTKVVSVGKVIFPNGGETFQPGQQITIVSETYDTLQFFEEIISITLDDGKTYSRINPKSAFRTPGTSRFEFTWTIPATLEGVAVQGKQARIKVTQYSGSDIDESDNSFCIGSCPSTTAQKFISRQAHPLAWVYRHGDATFLAINTAGPYTASIINARGEIVFKASGERYGRYEIRRNLAAGAHFLIVNAGPKKMIQKVIVQN
jgi:hypothetical protein